MPPTVTVGLDGSSESEAAVEWAAREALRRDAELDIVQVREAGPYPYSRILDDRVERDWGEKTTRDAAADLARRHPGLRTATHLYSGRPAKVLVEVSEDSDLLVLGSRGLGSLLGFLLGSVALPTVAHVRCPVVVVRKEHAESEDAAPGEPAGPVVTGLKLEEPADAILSFAFRTAERWRTGLRVVHGWELPPAFGTRPVVAPPGLVEDLSEEKGDALREVLAPWREKFPHVDVTQRVHLGPPVRNLLDAAEGASLAVVGRRNRRFRYGTQLGSVTHAVLNHADSPVAVVPHD